MDPDIPKPAAPHNRRLWRKVSTLWSQSWTTLIWLIPAWVLTGLFRALILTVSTRSLARLYGPPQGAVAFALSLSRHQEARARDISRAIGIAARYAPWAANCYAQALTARTLLGVHKIPHLLIFGLRQMPDGLAAHAWVTAGTVRVTGGRGTVQFRVMQVFSITGPAPIPDGTRLSLARQRATDAP